MIKTFILLGSMLLTSFAHASGTVTVQGKLISITDTDYVIETSTQVFNVRKTAVTKEQASSIERTEINVAITVPFNAVDSVHSKKK
jgi:hypothetical protein